VLIVVACVVAVVAAVFAVQASRHVERPPGDYPQQTVVNAPLDRGETAKVEGMLCATDTFDVLLFLSWTAVDADNDPLEGQSVTVVAGALQHRDEGCEWHGEECRSDADVCKAAFVNPMPVDVSELVAAGSHRWIIAGLERPIDGRPFISFASAPFTIR
jgi:hypothetical protein